MPNFRMCEVLRNVGRKKAMSKGVGNSKGRRILYDIYFICFLFVLCFKKFINKEQDSQYYLGLVF
jgi:hypothetical protein